MRRRTGIGAALGAALLAAPAAADCRLGLALALDISSSVNAEEYAIQIGGLAAALRQGDVREALLSQDGTVWIAVYEWSGYFQQDMVADWAAMTSPAAIDALAATLDAHKRTYNEFPTAIGRAAEFGANLLRRLPEPCARLVLDISGDGVNNHGVDPTHYVREGIMDGVVVNGLAIKGADPDPEPFYRARVIHGPGAFLMVARGGFEDYPEMIRRKLLREVAPELAIGALR